MTKSTYNIQTRLKVFWENINRPELKSPGFILNLSGWLLTFLFTAVSIANETGFQVVFLLSFGFFWYRLNKDIIKNFNPPTELLLSLLFIIYLFTYSLLFSAYSPYYPSQLNLDSVGSFTSFLYNFFLVILLLLFGLVLIINNTLFQKKLAGVLKISDKDEKQTNFIKQGVILGYCVIGLIAHHSLFFWHEYYLYLFQFILLLILLNRTNWLEKLSKVELWTYLPIFLFVFSLILNNSFIQEVRSIESEKAIFWFSVPLYLHLLIKIYLLALIIKIPIVLIYNHARLARKLWISGLFQSSFPQLIQFICLVFIFFFLISGWQAENFRETMYSKIEQIDSVEIPSEISYYQEHISSQSSTLSVEGYESIPFKSNYPDQGIIELIPSRQRDFPGNRNKDYFLYMKSTEYFRRNLNLVKLDAPFIKYLTEHISFLAGSGLFIYPYSLQEWQKFLFEWGFLDDDDRSKIYPFSITSDNTSWSLRSRMIKNDPPERGFDIRARESFDADQEFIVGRVLIPVVNDDVAKSSYISFDIFLILEYYFFETELFKIVLVLIIVFFLLNGFIIRRVVRFGTQINQIVIQKFNQLKTGIREISAGNLEYKFELEGEDEFVELASRFNQMGDKLKKTIAEAREKDRLDHELKMARQVQIGILPTKLPKVRGYKIAASIQTATEVGGDFYDVVDLGKNKFLFTIGDVSGKGSSAAFYMAQFMSLLRYSHQFTAKPDEITLRLNNYFTTHVADRQIFITAIIGILDIDKGLISFVRAGHTLPIIIPGDKNKKITEIDLQGLGIGLTKKQQMFKKSLKIHELSLEKSDMLVFYTDGVLEAAIKNHSIQNKVEYEVYGEERFIDILNKFRDRKADDLVNNVVNDIETFYSDSPKVDDYTLLIIQKTET